MNPFGSKRLAKVGFALLVCLGLACARSLAEEGQRPVDGIMDNSFLIEEAYNQEAGIVQHIFTGSYSLDRINGTRERRLDLLFTQEWPAYGQAHQLSFTVLYSFVEEAGNWDNGVWDVFLNYRYQAYFDEKTLTAFAPRFSLVLPTGDERKGFGNGTLGYQWNLPFSTTLGDRWFVHANAGLTFLPGAGEAPEHDLLNYNLGASAIYCASARLNFMVEWVGYWSDEVADSGTVDRRFASVISPGVRYAFNLSEETQAVVGLGVPIGLTRATPAIGVLLYLSFEHRMFGKKPEK